MLFYRLLYTAQNINYQIIENTVHNSDILSYYNANDNRMFKNAKFNTKLITKGCFKNSLNISYLLSVLKIMRNKSIVVIKNKNK